MSQSKQQQAEKPRRPYPLVKAGMRVLWYIDGRRTSPPQVAFVQAVGEKALDLAYLVPDYDRVQHVHGVRHVDEKGVTESAREESGGWEHSEETLWFYGEFPEYGEWPDEAKKPKDPKDKTPATGTGGQSEPTK